MDAYDGEREVMNIVHGLLDARRECRGKQRVLRIQQIVMGVLACWLIAKYAGLIW
jgi:hypothetical protein